jgi:hypothetical protein
MAPRRRLPPSSAGDDAPSGPFLRPFPGVAAVAAAPGAPPSRKSGWGPTTRSADADRLLDGWQPPARRGGREGSRAWPANPLVLPAPPPLPPARVPTWVAAPEAGWGAPRPTTAAAGSGVECGASLGPPEPLSPLSLAHMAAKFRRRWEGTGEGVRDRAGTMDGPSPSPPSGLPRPRSPLPHPPPPLAPAQGTGDASKFTWDSKMGDTVRAPDRRGAWLWLHFLASDARSSWKNRRAPWATRGRASRGPVVDLGSSSPSPSTTATFLLGNASRGAGQLDSCTEEGG